MKLIQNLLLNTLFLFLVACGGGGSTTDTTDSTQNNEDSTAEEANSEETSQKVVTIDVENEDVKMLIKRWKMTEYTHTDGKSEKNIKGAFLVLKEDGTFEELFNANVIASGKWSFEVEGKVISLMHETGEMKGDNEKLTVKELTADKLITLDDEGKMTETWMPEAEKAEEKSE
ncbi:MAG: hypothetical protein NW226_23140 [Microscillaceae bacterium]|nr:hypothetical protein [Microscillaceae bacterium]